MVESEVKRQIKNAGRAAWMAFLDYLAEITGCQYLSDLHYTGISSQQADSIRKLPDDRFPEKDYREAVAYLNANLPKNGQSISELKEAVIQKLNLK